MADAVTNSGDLRCGDRQCSMCYSHPPSPAGPAVEVTRVDAAKICRDVADKLAAAGRTEESVGARTCATEVAYALRSPSSPPDEPSVESAYREVVAATTAAGWPTYTRSDLEAVAREAAMWMSQQLFAAMGKRLTINKIVEDDPDIAEVVTRYLEREK